MTAFTRLLPFLLVVGTVSALAQPATPPPAPAPATPAPSANAQLTAGEMKARSETIISDAQDSYNHVVTLRERVRKMKDVIKLDCVNERLLQLKAQLNIADTANQSLLTALERDMTAARDLFTQLETSNHNIKELREQANQCVGAGDLYKQESGLEVTRPELPDDPGTIDPMLPGGEVVIEPPGYASAFM